MIRPIEFHLPIVSSTNDYARELLRSYPYVWVSAQHQTAGRGRKGRQWLGDFGANIYASLGIRHSLDVPVEELSAFMARGALAVLQVIRQHAPQIEARIKYPNDVQVRTSDGWSKIAGVLVEHEFQGNRCISTILGIGINVEQVGFPDTIGQRCTSLRLLDIPANPSVLITELRDILSDFMSTPWPEIHEKWVDELSRGIRRMRIEGDSASWSFVRVLPDGRLILKNEVTQFERTISDGDTVRYED